MVHKWTHLIRMAAVVSSKGLFSDCSSPQKKGSVVLEWERGECVGDSFQLGDSAKGKQSTEGGHVRDGPDESDTCLRHVRL